MNSGALALIRRSRRSAPYTAVSNSIIGHREISAEARLALIYLLSKPDDWQLQVDDLRRFLGKGDRPCGRDKAYGVLNELIASRYVIRTRKAEASSNRFSETIYEVFDEPRAGVANAAAQPFIAESDPLPPPPGFPDAEKPDPENKDTTKERREPNTEGPRPPPDEGGRKRRPSETGTGDLFLQLWDQWPAADRPRYRQAAERLFLKLDRNEQQQAFQHSGAYWSGGRRSSTFNPMIPYLRERRFRNFEGAPKMDGGHFIIAPDRPEWPAWMAHLRNEHSEHIVAKQEDTGILRTQTRWPESNKNSANSQGPSATQGSK